MTPRDFKVGQRLLAAYRDAAEWTTVTKIGRRWVETMRGDQEWTKARFDPQTMESDSDSDFAWGWWRYVTFYLSTEAREQALVDERTRIATTQAWAAFRTAIPYHRPPHLTLSDIATLRAKIVGEAEEGNPTRADAPPCGS